MRSSWRWRPVLRRPESTPSRRFAMPYAPWRSRVRSAEAARQRSRILDQRRTILLRMSEPPTQRPAPQGIRHRRIRHRTNHLRTNLPRTSLPRTTRLSTIPLRTTLRRTTRSQVLLFPGIRRPIRRIRQRLIRCSRSTGQSRANLARSCGEIARPHWQRGWSSGLNTTNTWPRAWPSEWRSLPLHMPQSCGSRPSWPTVRRQPRERTRTPDRAGHRLGGHGHPDHRHSCHASRPECRRCGRLLGRHSRCELGARHAPPQARSSPPPELVPTAE